MPMGWCSKPNRHFLTFLSKVLLVCPFRLYVPYILHGVCFVATLLQLAVVYLDALFWTMPDIFSCMAVSKSEGQALLLEWNRTDKNSCLSLKYMLTQSCYWMICHLGQKCSEVVLATESFLMTANMLFSDTPVTQCQIKAKNTKRVTAFNELLVQS